MNTYATISELIYCETHDQDENEIIIEKQPEWIEYDTSFLIDLALDTNDKEWFMKLTSN
jgi:uncharacterized protein YpiB (UPF0302 family)